MNTVPSFPQGPSLLSTIIEQDFDTSLVKIGTLINDNINSLVINTLISPDITVNNIELVDNRINNLEDPILDDQASTKSYVDNKQIIPLGPVNSLLLKDGNTFTGSSALTFTTSSILNINATLNANTVTCSNIQLGGINIYAEPTESYSIYVPNAYGVNNSMLGINSSNILTFYTNVIPSGSNEYIQFNNSGSFGSSSDLKYVNVNNTLYSNIYCKILSTSEIISDDLTLVDQLPSVTSAYVFTFPVTNVPYDFIFPNNSGASSQIMGINTVGEIFWTNNGLLSAYQNSIQYNHDYDYDSSPTFTYDSSLNVLSIDNLINQNPTNPIILNTVSIGFGIGKGCSDLNYTYICLTNSIKVISATQSLSIPITGTVVNAVVDTSALYVISQSGSTGYLTIIDTSTFSQVSQKSIPLILTNITVNGTCAYIVGSSTLIIIDLSTSSLLTIGTNTSVPNATDVSVSGSYIYVSCNNDIFSLKIISKFYPYNIINTINVSLLGSIGLAVIGQYVYTIGSSLFNVINVSDPTTPIVFQSITLGSSLSAIYATNKYAYVVSTSGTLYIIDLENSYTVSNYAVSNYTSSLLLSAKSIILLSSGFIGICTDLLLNTFSTSVLSSSNIANILVTDLKVSDTMYCDTLTSSSSLSTVYSNIDKLLLNSSEVSTISSPSTITNNSNSLIIDITSSLAVESVLQITLNNTNITSESIILVSVYNCSNTSVIPAVNVSNVSDGVCIIRVKNVGLINFSGQVKIFCLVL